LDSLAVQCHQLAHAREVFVEALALLGCGCDVQARDLNTLSDPGQDLFADGEIATGLSELAQRIGIRWRCRDRQPQQCPGRATRRNSRESTFVTKAMNAAPAPAGALKRTGQVSRYIK
jgi:hypothetical protein